MDDLELSAAYAEFGLKAEEAIEIAQRVHSHIEVIAQDGGEPVYAFKYVLNVSDAGDILSPLKEYASLSEAQAARDDEVRWFAAMLIAGEDGDGCCPPSWATKDFKW